VSRLSEPKIIPTRAFHDDDDDEPELDVEERERLRAELLSTRHEVSSRSRERAREALADSAMGGDDADQASSSTTQAFDLRLAEKDRKLLELIEHALEKFALDTYGLCEGTGEPIAVARLRLRPWARFSVDHKQVLERDRAMHEDALE
jgi:DnaK suppressor protein